MPEPRAATETGWSSESCLWAELRARGVAGGENLHSNLQSSFHHTPFLLQLMFRAALFQELGETVAEMLIIACVGVAAAAAAAATPHDLTGFEDSALRPVAPTTGIHPRL